MAPIQRIESIQQLNGLLDTSKDRPVWIFKHSLTCPISFQAWDEFRRFAAEGPEDVVFALIEVQNDRPVSNAIALRTGIRHQSPQAILLRDAMVAWHASHWDIQFSRLKAA